MIYIPDSNDVVRVSKAFRNGPLATESKGRVAMILEYCRPSSGYHRSLVVMKTSYDRYLVDPTILVHAVHASRRGPGSSGFVSSIPVLRHVSNPFELVNKVAS